MLPEPDTNEAYGFMVESMNNAESAIRRMESWREAHGARGLAYHRAVSAHKAMEAAREYLALVRDEA